MSSVEPLIASELDQMLPLPDGRRADWNDVLRRAGLVSNRKPVRVRRRSTLALAGAIVVGLAIAVPASGLPHDIINWFSAPTAPEPTQKSFQSLDIGAPAGMAPGVSGSARSVMDARIEGKDVHLWVAPTRGGGFCLELEDYGGGCDRDRQLPINWTIGEHTAKSLAVISGDVLSPQVNHLEVRFASGQSVSIPVVYVSEPINASFFIYRLPAGGPQTGDWPATLQAVRDDGSVIASTTLPSFRVPTPPSSP
jgi:hypothetical protein